MYVKDHMSICKSLGQACAHLINQQKMFPLTFDTFYCALTYRMVFNMYYYVIVKLVRTSNYVAAARSIDIRDRY